jgi:hypothetical protein
MLLPWTHESRLAAALKVGKISLKPDDYSMTKEIPRLTVRVDKSTAEGVTVTRKFMVRLCVIPSESVTLAVTEQFIGPFVTVTPMIATVLLAAFTVVTTFVGQFTTISLMAAPLGVCAAVSGESVASADCAICTVTLGRFAATWGAATAGVCDIAKLDVKTSVESKVRKVFIV